MLFLLLALFSAVSCQPKPEIKTLRIGINLWPGYEPLFYAWQQGYLSNDEIALEMVEFPSLSAVLNAYETGSLDMACGTLVEYFFAQKRGGEELEAILITDESLGGDVILSRVPLEALPQDRKWIVGCEVDSVGMLLLQQFLERHEIPRSRIELVNGDYFLLERLYREGSLDLCVTYPPVSSRLMKDPGGQVIFSSAMIPGKIVDLVFTRKDHPDKEAMKQLLRQGWERFWEDWEDNPGAVSEAMASRLKISVRDLSEALELIRWIPPEDQANLLNNTSWLEAREQDARHAFSGERVDLSPGTSEGEK